MASCIKSNITVAQVAMIIEVLYGRRFDPIYRKRGQTTIANLAKTEGDSRAKHVYITYHMERGIKRRTTVYNYMLKRIRSCGTEARP